MKIIHINLQKSWRGGEQQLAYLLKALKDKNIEQVLICSTGSKLEAFSRQESIDYISLKNGFFQKIKNLNILYSLIKNNSFDLIHCHESKGHSLALFTKIIYGFKAKIILHRRVIFPVKGLFSRKIKYSSKYINKIICISKAVESSIHKSTSNKNTIIIPSMTDINYNYINQNILKTKYKIPDKKIIGYIAALTFEKDHYTFLNTAKILITENDNLHFVLIGEGKNKEKLIDYTKQIGLINNVSFTGFIDDAKKLIPEIDVLLFTSTKEGLGSTVLDFFVARKPVVTVKNGGTEDLVFNGQTGFICNQKDSKTLAKNVNYILENPAESNKITENAYQFVKDNFSIEAVTSKIIDFYKKII